MMLQQICQRCNQCFECDLNAKGTMQLRFCQPCRVAKASKALDKLVGSWTIDYAIEAFVVYFDSNRWLLEKIVERILKQDEGKKDDYPN